MFKNILRTLAVMKTVRRFLFYPKSTLVHKTANNNYLNSCGLFSHYSLATVVVVLLFSDDKRKNFLKFER